MTNSNPLVSVGIPVYNSESFMRRALDALVGQTYENLELIVSDNASTDRTEAICREYAKRDQRIKYHRNPTNIGVYANFRQVFARSAGEFFMWAAADDVRPPTAVARCVEALRRNERAVMAHGVVLVQKAGQQDLLEYPNAVCLSDADAAARVRAFTRGLCHNAMLYGLYRRSALAKGILGRCYGQDYLLCLQMCLLGPIAYVSTPMLICRERHPLPSHSPMYTDRPVTVWSLLHDQGLRRRKCWTVLVMGGYYLAKVRGVRFPQRLEAIAAHVSTFCQRYRAQLAKEVVFQLCEPVAWLGVLFWRLAHRWSSTWRLARRVHAIIARH
jgi:glycosyltransferase involved in cell wall biosynthesis